MASTGKTRQSRQDRAAAALAYAEIHGDAEAAKKFGISERSVRAYRTAASRGQLPQAAESMAGVRQRILARSEDVLVDALEAGILEIKRRFPSMEAGDLIKAVDMLGELRLGRDYLNDEGDLPTQKVAGSQAAQGEPSDRAGGASGAADGSPGARSSRTPAPN